MRRTAPMRVWGALTGLYVVAYVAAVAGRQLFVPDTRYYAATTLRITGQSKAEAVETLRSYMDALPSPIQVQNPSSVLFDYGLTGPRILYPLLSAPFVKAFGLTGLAVVPALSIGGLVVATFVAVAGRWGWRATLLPLVLVAADWRLMTYGANEITEGLTTFICALILLVVLRRERLGTRTTAIWLVLLTTAMAFTRQATLIPAAAFAFAWFALTVRRRAARNRWAMPALVTTATALVVQVVQGVVWPGFSQIGQLEKATHTLYLASALKQLPHLFVHIEKTDLMNLARSNQPMVLLIAAGIASVLFLWRYEETYLLIGSMAAAVVYNVSNGTPVGFRYEYPALPFLVLSVAALAWWLGLRGRRGERPKAVQPRLDESDGPAVSVGTPMPA